MYHMYPYIYNIHYIILSGVFVQLEQTGNTSLSFYLIDFLGIKPFPRIC